MSKVFICKYGYSFCLQICPAMVLRDQIKAFNLTVFTKNLYCPLVALLLALILILEEENLENW